MQRKQQICLSVALVAKPRHEAVRVDGRGTLSRIHLLHGHVVHATLRCPAFYFWPTMTVPQQRTHLRVDGSKQADSIVFEKLDVRYPSAVLPYQNTLDLHTIHIEVQRTHQFESFTMSSRKPKGGNSSSTSYGSSRNSNPNNLPARSNRMTIGILGGLLPTPPAEGRPLLRDPQFDGMDPPVFGIAKILTSRKPELQMEIEVEKKQKHKKPHRKGERCNNDPGEGPSRREGSNAPSARPEDEYGRRGEPVRDPPNDPAPDAAANNADRNSVRGSATNVRGGPILLPPPPQPAPGSRAPSHRSGGRGSNGGSYHDSNQPT